MQLQLASLSLRVAAFMLVCVPAVATPAFVEHIPTNQVFGEAPGVTARSPAVPREDETVTIWPRIAYSFYYTDVAIYYTTDGSAPSGSKGVPAGSAQVLRSSMGQVTFVRNEPSMSGNIDWWAATLPAPTRGYATQVRYIIGAWHSGGGIEVFSNNYNCEDDVCDNPANPALVHSFTNKLAWPGAGSGSPMPSAGYPPVHFWKEEAVFGNQYCAGMVDQNGSLYDFQFPSVGAVNGVGTRNEGYSNGIDTYPPLLAPEQRGQMHINTLMPGIRYNGLTYWISNSNGGDYTGLQQQYVSGSNTILTSATLTAGGANILVQQYDFSPAGVTYPLSTGGQPNRNLHIKQMILTNQSDSPVTVNVYVYGDFALNGHDNYDVSFIDAPRGTMVTYDNTYRLAAANGEYNPTTFSDYEKNVSVYLGVVLKNTGTPGSSGGTPATDFWRDSNSDNGLGWIGLKLTLPAGTPVELSYATIGGFERPAGQTGTYAAQIAPAVDWFLAANVQDLRLATDNFWLAYLANGTTVDFPNPAYTAMFERALLCSAVMVDAEKGGIIAGMHNGAYPFVWPRDAAYAAVSFIRVGHFNVSEKAHEFLREHAFREFEPWGRKGFWKQKYTTDGYTIWGAPQVDETSCFPWSVYHHYLATGDMSFLTLNWDAVKDAAIASTTDSVVDTRLYYDDTFKLVHSMNVWEDSFNLFPYSNSSIERGLRDAASIATVLGYPADSADFLNRRNNIYDGLIDRLNANVDNSDISLLGIIYPFETLSPLHPRAEHIKNLINGTAQVFSQFRPLVRVGGEWDGLIDRYWGDTYWNGGPWFLSTAWYGLYYAHRANFEPGDANINLHKQKIDLLIDRLGPMGLGAEQIAPLNSLMYPGQPDFVLQTAWPNVWESMSTLMDSVMAFLDWRPDAPSNTMRMAPKLPTAWSTFTYNNLRMGTHRFNTTVTREPRALQQTLVNVTGNAANVDTTLRVPAGSTLCTVTVNGVPVSYTYDATLGTVRVVSPVATGTSAATVVRVQRPRLGDVVVNCAVQANDLAALLSAYGSVGPHAADLNADNTVDVLDLELLLAEVGLVN